jgi:hypothetical protein
MEFLPEGGHVAGAPGSAVYTLQIAYGNSWITPIDRYIIHISRPS